jgi:hypothetical protein|tara:strand:- start:853 stop:1122 length:270 start_codon:yes stop_codon:yes gene_type:complete
MDTLSVVKYFKSGFRFGLLVKDGKKYDHILESDFKIRKHVKNTLQHIDYSPYRYIDAMVNGKYSRLKYYEDSLSKPVKKILGKGGANEI